MTKKITFSSDKPSNKAKKVMTLIAAKGTTELILDRLTITAKVNSEKLQDEIRKAAYSASKDIGYVYNLPSKGKPYKVNLHGHFGPNKGSVLYQTQPKSPKNPYIRLDFNPSALGPEGMDELKAWLNIMIPDGYDYLLLQGRVSRIDTALDFHGLTLDQFQVLSDYPVMIKEWKRDGKTKTIYLGSSKAQRQVRIYDKASEVKSKSKGGLPKVLGKVTRIERMQRTGVQMMTLRDFQNPFHNLTASTLPPCPKGFKGYLWEMFLDTCAQRNVNATIQLLPVKQRGKFRKALKANPIAEWKPDVLWGDWSKVLEELGILKFFNY